MIAFFDSVVKPDGFSVEDDFVLEVVFPEVGEEILSEKNAEVLDIGEDDIDGAASFFIEDALLEALSLTFDKRLVVVVR